MRDGGASRLMPGVAVIDREDLLDRLMDNAAVPVVVMHAGAGFGKTTLARQWAQRDPRPHETVRLARFLDDPAALASRVIQSLESLGSATGAIRDVVTGAEPEFSALLLPALTRLVRSLEHTAVLVFDDVQLLSRPQCQAVLSAVVDGVPAGSQVAILTRMEPPVWLARTRAEGHLLELGPGDLAFTDAESHRLLDSLGPDIPRERAEQLITRAEGWPVGLYLTASARQSPGSLVPTDFDVRGSDRSVVDYLRAEVLAGLPKRMADFLRRTAVLDELSGPLCDAVLRRRDSAAVLTELSRRLQLVVCTDPELRHYRYHHLLADALLADLDGHEPWLEPELHARACAWYGSHGDLDAAIRHAKAGGDLSRTGTLVWAGVPRCIASGRPDRLAAWLADLDDVQVRSDRWLTLASAWLGLQSGDPDRMTRWLLAADEHAGADWPTRVAGDEYAASLAAIHVVVGDAGLKRGIELCRAARLGLPADSGFRAATFHNEGVALTLTGHVVQGQALLEEAERLGRALGVPIIEANALAWRGMLALLTGDRSRGEPLVARAADLARTHRLERLATAANCITAVALLTAVRGSKDEARVTLGTARRLTSRTSQIAPWFAVAGRVVQARTAILLGDGALARTLCSEADEHMTADLEGTLLSAMRADTEKLLRALQNQHVTAAAITAAELRVLQFLPSRLTFQQIGEHLFLSQTTVKTHALSIYRKLGASSRDEAVARARALGLVESPPLG